jgi:hypothetical protein
LSNWARFAPIISSKEISGDVERQAERQTHGWLNNYKEIIQQNSVHKMNAQFTHVRINNT